MAEWGLFAATVLIQLLGLAFFYGVAWEKVKSHSKALEWVGEKFKEDEVKQDARWEHIAGEQKDQWGGINDAHVDIAKIKGHLGLNGVYGK